MADAQPNPNIAQFLEPIHPRDQAIEAAVKELLPFLQELAAKHSLTEAEFLFILTTVKGRTLQGMCLRERSLPKL